MIMIKNFVYITLLILAVSLSLLSCSSSDSHSLKVGVTAGPEQEIAEAAKAEAKERFGLEVKLITFNDYVMPNEALHNKDIDINAFQHLPYLETQSKQRGYHLIEVGKTFIYPITAYSKKIRALSELKKGGTVAIPNDPTNGARALLLLEKHGLISLDPNAGTSPRLLDIQENPLSLKILEIEAPQLPRVLDDKEVIIAIINNTFSAQAGLDYAQHGLFQEESDSPYVNLIVARKDNYDSEQVRQFVEAYQSERVAEKAKEIFGDSAIKGW